MHQGTIPVALEQMRQTQRSGGYAVTPHAAHGEDSLKDGDRLLAYGDSSFSFDYYVGEEWSEWGLVGTEISFQDPC